MMNKLKFNHKINNAFIRIDEDFSPCKFKYNWKK